MELTTLTERRWFDDSQRMPSIWWRWCLLRRILRFRRLGSVWRRGQSLLGCAIPSVRSIDSVPANCRELISAVRRPFDAIKKRDAGSVEASRSLAKLRSTDDWSTMGLLAFPLICPFFQVCLRSWSLKWRTTMNQDPHKISVDPACFMILWPFRLFFITVASISIRTEWIKSIGSLRRLKCEPRKDERRKEKAESALTVGLWFAVWRHFPELGRGGGGGAGGSRARPAPRRRPPLLLRRLQGRALRQSARPAASFPGEFRRLSLLLLLQSRCKKKWWPMNMLPPTSSILTTFWEFCCLRD